MSESYSLRRENFAPTVLLIDDDPILTRRWRREFHRSTSLGVLSANTLKQGRELVESSGIRIDAIVADILFENGSDDRENHIINGLDLLSHLQKTGVSLPTFVISASSEMMDFKKRAEEEGIKVHSYFDKLFAADPRSPAWIEIQKAVLAQRFGSTSDITQTLDSASNQAARLNDGDFCEAVNAALCKLQLPVRTYLQSLGDDVRFTLVKPIEVICIAEGNDEIRAYAPSLGLLTAAVGFDVESAIDELRENLIVDLETLFDVEPGRLSDYSRKVVSKLQEFCIIGDGRDC